VVTQDPVQAFLQVSANLDVPPTKFVKSTVILTTDGTKTTGANLHLAKAYHMIIVVRLLHPNHITAPHLVIIVVSLHSLQISPAGNTIHILKIIGEMIILDNPKVRRRRRHHHHHHQSIPDKT